MALLHLPTVGTRKRSRPVSEQRLLAVRRVRACVAGVRLSSVPSYEMTSGVKSAGILASKMKRARANVGAWSGVRIAGWDTDAQVGDVEKEGRITYTEHQSTSQNEGSARTDRMARWREPQRGQGEGLRGKVECWAARINAKWSETDRNNANTWPPTVSGSAL
jgi:hypothetical protein